MEQEQREQTNLGQGGTFWKDRPESHEKKWNLVEGDGREWNIVEPRSMGK